MSRGTSLNLWWVVAAWAVTIVLGLPVWFATGLWVSMDGSWNLAAGLGFTVLTWVLLAPGPVVTAFKAGRQDVGIALVVVLALVAGYELTQVASIYADR